MSKNELSAQRKAFAAEYITNGFKGTEAAIAAGYAKNSAHVTATRLLKDAKIRAYVNEVQAKASVRTQITQDRVLQEIAIMAFFDPAEFMIDLQKTYPDAEWSSNGKAIYGLTGPTDIKDLPEGVRRAIVGWSWDKNGRFVIKLADKQKALDQLGKHLKLFTDRVEHTGEINIVPIDDDDKGLIG